MSSQIVLILQTTINGLGIGAVYALIAIGLALTFGVLRIINFAHGEFVMVGMYAGLFTVLATHGGLSWGVVATITTACLFGILIYYSLFRWIERRPPEDSLLISIGLSLVLSNLALILFSPDYRTLNTPYAIQAWQWGEISIPFMRALAFGCVMVLTILLHIFLRQTQWGRSIRATIQHRIGAQLTGVNVRAMSCLAIAIGAALCGVAGVLLLPTSHVYPSVGLSLTLKSFIIVVLGGLGSIYGALAAGFLLGIGESFASVYVSGDLKEALGLVLFIGALMIRPQGLLDASKEV